jgi:multiple sugar transport system ATP-binding protein
MTMASRIVVMKDGIIQQVDTPQNLYDLPVNLFVAGFIGTPQMNFINGKLIKKKNDENLYFTFGDSNEFKLPEEKMECEELQNYVGKEVIAGIRSEAIHDEPMYLSQFSDWVIDASVDVTELMGAEIFLYINSQGQNLIARVSPRSKAKPGDSVKVAFDVNRLHIFDKDTELCICH